MLRVWKEIKYYAFEPTDAKTDTIFSVVAVVFVGLCIAAAIYANVKGIYW